MMLILCCRARSLIGRWMNNLSSMSAMLQHFVELSAVFRVLVVLKLEFSFCIGKVVGSNASWKKWWCSFYEAEHFRSLQGCGFNCQLKKWKKNSFYEAEQVCSLAGEWTIFLQYQQFYNKLWSFKLMSNFFQKWKWLEFSLCVGKLVGSSASWRNDNSQIFKAEHLHLLVGERTFFAQCQQSYKSLWRFQLLRNFCMESEIIDFSLLVGKVLGSSAGWKKW